MYGVPGQDCSNQAILDRMRRSRDDKRKRSSSRDKNRLSRKLSRDGSENEETNSYASSSFYDNSSYSQSNQARNANPLR